MINTFHLPSGYFLEGVVSRGVPNEERIAIRTTAFCETTNMGLMVGYKNMDHSVVPMRNFLYWFGPAVLGPGTTINIFTGGGENSDYNTGNGLRVHNLFWGLDMTVFNHPSTVPILFSLGAAVCDRSPPLPQNFQPLPQDSSGNAANELMKALGFKASKL